MSQLVGDLTHKFRVRVVLRLAMTIRLMNQLNKEELQRPCEKKSQDRPALVRHLPDSAGASRVLTYESTPYWQLAIF
ncbi:MAG: hypothetical protein A2W25_13480 [candidate division Zixibacteria bacterium RBG_16_53_22]|nr:MAG: hypothetical protein A2W25_13480 [candidate division Zixibacteria bacterium RBG_16_53_22]